MVQEIARLRAEALRLRTGVLLTASHFRNAFLEVVEFQTRALLSGAGASVPKGGVWAHVLLYFAAPFSYWLEEADLTEFSVTSGSIRAGWLSGTVSRGKSPCRPAAARSSWRRYCGPWTTSGTSQRGSLLTPTAG